MNKSRPGGLKRQSGLNSNIAKTKSIDNLLELISVTETPAMKVDKAAEVIDKYTSKRFHSKMALKEKTRKRNALSFIHQEKLNSSTRL